ncbi:hypothetical protein [Methylosinus sp. Ce-a6]|uniref:hypothetical protein n=1 Tax=Methylosinus sp. Ce-a6 TaxID=2172005 RepID=UPI0013597A6F|nr:hypothetical protein [Methylosinus sp. Ce-a6]
MAMRQFVFDGSTYQADISGVENAQLLRKLGRWLEASATMEEGGDAADELHSAICDITAGEFVTIGRLAKRIWWRDGVDWKPIDCDMRRQMALVAMFLGATVAEEMLEFEGAPNA